MGGLERNDADKRLAVERLLSLLPDASDREIAEHCHVSKTIVSVVRRSLSHPPPEVRGSGDGQTQSIPKRNTQMAIR
jgi:hypothetical protein